MNGNSVPSSGTTRSQVQTTSRGPGGPSPWVSLRGNRVDATASPPLAGLLLLDLPATGAFYARSAQHAGFVAGGRQLCRDGLGVLVPARFQHEFDAGLAHVK